MKRKLSLKKKSKISKEISEAHILIIRLSAIGDVILATSTLNFLLKYLKPEQITWVGSEPSLSLVKDSYPQIQYYDFKKLTYKINHLPKVTHIFDLQGNLKTKWFSFLVFVRDFASYFSVEKKYFFRLFLLFQARFRRRTVLLEKKNLKADFFYQYKLMLNCVNSFLNVREYQLYSHTPKLSKKNSLSHLPLSSQPILAVAPGASYSCKKAPNALLLKIIHCFIEILEKKNNSKVTLIFLGDLRDKREIKPLLNELRKDIHYLDLSGTMDLTSLPDVLVQARVLLTNDSGLLHLSEALGTPVASLFGPTSEEFGFRPFLKKSRSFSTELSCRPCSKHGKSSCRFGDNLCFNGLNESEIARYLSQFF
jgi:ADP-heptose:LPS heptosyltransferase